MSGLIDISVTPPPKGQIGAVKSALRRLTLRVGRAHAHHQQDIDRGLLRAIEMLDRGQAALQSQVDELRAWLQVERGAGADSDRRLQELTNQLRDLGTWASGLSEQISALEHRQPRADSLVAINAPLHGRPALRLETFDSGHAGTVVGFRTAERDARGPDAIYLGFEDCFRGSEEIVRERQRRYLPLLAGHAPVLDVGCGRGEFLELVTDAGIEAHGVDLDPAMVAHCREKGLVNVQQADGVGHLDGLQHESVGTVFASHVIEHLAYEQLLRFLVSSREKLVPGGQLVMETVNPHSPQALKHFWIDPTHRHPLFPEVMIALCRFTGFASAYVWHPRGVGDPDRDRIEQPDYSVVAAR